jgi:hypothetical protein
MTDDLFRMFSRIKKDTTAADDLVFLLRVWKPCDLGERPSKMLEAR